MNLKEFLAAVEADEKALRESGKVLDVGPEIADGHRLADSETKRLSEELDAHPVQGMRIV